MRQIALLASFVVAALVLSPNEPWSAESRRPPQIQAAATQEPAASNQPGTNDSPLIVKVLPTPKTETEAAQDAQDRQEKADSDAAIIRLTGFLVAIGALQLLVFGWQGWQLRQTVRAMREIANDQTEDMQAYITAAGRSAGAMERVADSMGKNVETTTGIAVTQRDFWSRQMRAYVLPQGSSILDGTTTQPPLPALAGVPGVVLSIKNSGLTPAYGVVSWASIDVIDVKNENTLVVPPIAAQFTNTLAPQGVITKVLRFHRALTPHEISDIGTGVRAIYVYGRVEYRDVLDVDRYSNFRLHYTGVYPPSPSTLLNFSETGNDTN